MDESVTVTAVHEVAYGREDDFYAWAASWLRQAEESDDFLGGGILGPSVAGGDWHVIYRWVDHASAQWWEDAAIRAGWMDGAESFARPVQVQQITGLRAWFEKRAQATSPPPKWKMALVTLTAVFPPVLLFNVTLIPRLLGLPVVIRTLALCIGVTVVVTWVMMPRLMRLLKDWLHAPPAQLSPETRVRAPMMAANWPERDANRRVMTPVSTGRRAPGDDDQSWPAPQGQPRQTSNDQPWPTTQSQRQRTTDDQPRRNTQYQAPPAAQSQPWQTTQAQPWQTINDQPWRTTQASPRQTSDNQPWPAPQDQPQHGTDNHPRPATQRQPWATTQSQPRQATNDQPWATTQDQPRQTSENQPRRIAQYQSRPAAQSRPRRSAQDRSWPIPETQPQRTAPDQSWRQQRPTDGKPNDTPEYEPVYKPEYKYTPEFESTYEPEPRPAYDLDPRPAYEPEPPRPAYEPEPQAEYEPDQRPEYEPEYEPDEEPDEEPEYEPEPEPRVPRSPARTGRPVLNLIRDGQPVPPRSRRPPHRDDRSAYLRREIG